MYAMVVAYRAYGSLSAPPMFFTPPTETSQQATVSEVKNNLARTLDEASKGTETIVTRHSKAVAVVVSPSAHSALRNFRRAVAQAFDSSLRRLAHLRASPSGADGPSPDAIALMESLLNELRGVLDIGPDRTVTTAEGGVDAYFFSAERDEEGSPARYVSIGVDRDGDASVLFANGSEATAEDLTPGTEARAVAARITEFLSGADEPQSA